MTKFNQFKTRGLALVAGTAVATMALMPATARADSDDNEKAYKVGAAVLGAASVLMILKGKNVEGAVAGAGAYYAYKKSQDAKRERTSQYPDYDVYSQYPGNNSYPTNYPGSYNNYPDNNYPGTSTYPDYRAPGDVYASYPGSTNAPAYLAPRTQNRNNVRLK